MYKILNHNLKHLGFQYQIGLNVDTRPFEHPYGLHYSNLIDVWRFVDYGCYIAVVEPAENAKIRNRGSGVFATDRLIIKSYMPITEFINANQNPNTIVTIDSIFMDIAIIFDIFRPDLFEILKNPSLELQKLYTRRCYTDEIIRIFKKSNDIHDQELQLAAIEAHPQLIAYINPSEEIQIKAVNMDPDLIMFIKNPCSKVLEFTRKNKYIEKRKQEFYKREELEKTIKKESMKGIHSIKYNSLYWKDSIPIGDKKTN